MVAAQVVVERIEPETARRGLLVPVGFEVADKRGRGISPLFERLGQRRIGVPAPVEAGGRTRGCGQQPRVDEQLGIRRTAVLDLRKHLRKVEYARVPGQRIEERLDLPSVDFETDRPAGLRLHEDEDQVFPHPERFRVWARGCARHFRRSAGPPATPLRYSRGYWRSGRSSSWSIRSRAGRPSARCGSGAPGGRNSSDRVGTGRAGWLQP